MQTFSPKLPSPPGCHITLSRVPCAIYLYIPVQALVGCPFRIQQCVHVHPQLPNYPFPSSFPLATISSFSKSASLFLFVHFLFLYVHFYHFFLDSTYKGCHTIFLFLRLTYSTWQSLVHQYCRKWHYFILFNGIHDNLWFFFFFSLKSDSSLRLSLVSSKTHPGHLSPIPFCSVGGATTWTGSSA